MTRTRIVTIALVAIVVAGCTTVGTAPDTATAPPPADTEPLLMNISIHTDGYQTEDEDGGEAVFNAHLAALTGLADDVDGGDGVQAGEPKLTFELTADFVRATVKWGSDFIPTMDARGHGIGVHADLGGQGPIDRTVFTAELTSMREAIEAQGVDIVHVSGICSPSEWVESAIDAGFTATTGMIEYCQSSLPGSYPLPCGDQADECHGAAVTDWEHKLHPWRTSTSADWLTNDPSGQLLLVANAGGDTVGCMRENASGLTCAGVTDSGDIDQLRTVITDFVAHREVGRVDVLTVSWAIGRPPTAGFADSLLAMVAEFSDSVEWATMDEIIAVTA